MCKISLWFVTWTNNVLWDLTIAIETICCLIQMSVRQWFNANWVSFSLSLTQLGSYWQWWPIVAWWNLMTSQVWAVFGFSKGLFPFRASHCLNQSTLDNNWTLVLHIGYLFLNQNVQKCKHKINHRNYVSIFIGNFTPRDVHSTKVNRMVADGQVPTWHQDTVQHVNALRPRQNRRHLCRPLFEMHFPVWKLKYFIYSFTHFSIPCV